ncbi:MAG: DNA-binding response regulator [Verrucomicrobiota bacterium]|jgi:hypothetical protein
MTAPLIAPLRNRGLDGKLYTRPPGIEAKLVEISTLTRDEISTRCAIEDSESPEHLPSECLVYLIREYRSKPLDDCAEAIFKTLMERVLRGLPQGESSEGEKEWLTDANVRDEARYRFVEMLAKDRVEYLEALDIYEVRFQMALKALRVSAQRKIYRQDNPLETIEGNPQTGEIAEKVERAAGMFDPLDLNLLDDPNYRLRLDKAIDGLPPFQKAIIEMIRKGIPIESNDAETVNISNTLGKTPKTIRTHRDMAYATLRAELMKGE